MILKRWIKKRDVIDESIKLLAFVNCFNDRPWRTYAKNTVRVARCTIDTARWFGFWRYTAIVELEAGTPFLIVEEPGVPTKTHRLYDSADLESALPKRHWKEPRATRLRRWFSRRRSRMSSGAT